jgi:DNA-binding GntR family transcriptional regulator
MLLSLHATPGMLSVAFTRSKKRRLDGLDEHRRFLTACRDRDLKAAEAVFRRHSSASFDEMEAFLARQPIE